MANNILLSDLMSSLLKVNCPVKLLCHIQDYFKFFFIKKKGALAWQLGIFWLPNFCYNSHDHIQSQVAQPRCTKKPRVVSVTNKPFGGNGVGLVQSRGGGTPIHYLYGYVPPNGVVILKLLIQNGVSISEAFSRTGYNISNVRKLQFCQQPFEIIQGKIAFENTVQCVNKQTVVFFAPQNGV